MGPSSPAICVRISQSTGLNRNAFAEKGEGDVEGQEEHTHSLHTQFGLNYGHIKCLPVY